jgi:hypothetical protein
MTAHTVAAVAAVTFRDGVGVDDLTWLAGLISVIAVIVGAVWTMLKPLKRQADRIEAFWDDWQGTPARPGHSEVPGVMQRLQSIDGELQRNGGNSLKDQVYATARKVDELAAQNRHEHTDLADQIRTVKDEAQRWHEARREGPTDEP